MRRRQNKTIRMWIEYVDLSAIIFLLYSSSKHASSSKPEKPVKKEDLKGEEYPHGIFEDFQPANGFPDGIVTPAGDG